MTTGTRWALAAALSAVLAAPVHARRPAAPQPKPPDVQLFVEAKQLFDAGDYPAAVERFEASWRLSGHPKAAFALGVTFERMGEFEKAAEWYGRVADDPKAADAADARKRVARLAAKPSAVRVASDPASASVREEGGTPRVFGATPLGFELEPGTHALVVEKEGFEPARRTVIARFGVKIVLDVALKPVAPPDGRLIVLAQPPGARVEIDGRDAGPAPVEVGAAPGPHVVVVRAAGHAEQRSEVTVAAGEAARVEATLVALAAAATWPAAYPAEPEIAAEAEAPRTPNAEGRTPPAWRLRALAGPALQDYGADRLDASATTELGLVAGRVLGGETVAAELGAAVLFASLRYDDVEDGADVEKRAWFSNVLARAALLVRASDAVTLGASVGAGASLLSGASARSVFFRAADAFETSGTFLLPIVRAELDVSFRLAGPLTFELVPIAYDWSPRIDAFTNEDVRRVTRLHFAAGLGVEL